MNEEEKDIKEQANQVPDVAENESPVTPEDTETDPADESGETAPAEPAEPTARQKALARLRSRNADREFADGDDDAVFGAINDDYDADNAELEGYRGDAQKWNDFLGSDYKAAAYMDSWQENGSPIYALVDEYGEDIVADITNPDNKAKVKEHETARLQKLAKQKELDEEYNNNIEQSKQLVEQLKESGQYKPEDVDAAIDYIKDTYMKFLVGQVDEDMISHAIKAINHDSDMADAESRGETKGRNANIAKGLATRSAATDGIPALGGGSGKTEEPEGETQQYGKKRSMWG